MLLAGCRVDSPARRVEAERHYRAGIAHLGAGDLAAAREEMHRGTQLAPMDPALYLPLARACRDRGLTQRAVEFYQKYLSSSPADAVAAAELGAIDAEFDDVLREERPLWPPLLLLSLFVVGAALWL